MILFFLFLANGYSDQSSVFPHQEHLLNKIEEIRSQAQRSTDISTEIQQKQKLSNVPELLYRIETINTYVHQLQEIHKNQH